MIRSLMLLPALAILSACQSTEGSAQPDTGEVSAVRATLTGTATYLQRISLPDNAVLNVKISDVSLADAPSVTIAETDIHTAGRQAPIAFSLDYDPTKIIARRTYAVSARIKDGSGKLLWITDTRVNLPPLGSPAHLTLVQAQR